MTAMSLLLGFVASLFHLSRGALTDAQKADLLDFHNYYRSQTAQGLQTCASGFGKYDDTTCPAGTLQKLKWDSGLATTAQNFADDLVAQFDYCGLAHSSSGDRSTWLTAETTSFTYSGGYIGENLAVAGGGRSPRDTCTGWVVGESEFFIYGENDESVSQYVDDSGTRRTTQIGHHTQVVSQYSEYVGCGCSTGDDNECGYSTLFCVCHYYPGGNCNGCGGIDYTSYPYPNDGACGSCDSGDTCNSNTDYLCDDGASDGLPGSTPEPTSRPTDADSTPEPTARPTTSDPTPLPTTRPTPELSDNNNDDTSTATDGCVVSSTLSQLNGQSFPAITNAYTSLSQTVYGPFAAYGYNLLLLYSGNYWFMVVKEDYDLDGTISYFAYCQCDDCTIFNCPSWSRYITGVSTTTAAYSVTSSSDKDDNQLIEGLMIGLAIAIGVFIIGLIIYCLVKRRNSKQSRYNVVEMNNEISDHDYVNMGN